MILGDKRCCVVSLEINLIDYERVNEFDLIHSTNSMIIPLIKLSLLN